MQIIFIGNVLGEWYGKLFVVCVRVCICVGLHGVVLDGTATNFVYSCPLPYLVAPVFVQVVCPPFGWSPLSSFLGLQVVTRDVHRPI